MIARFRGWVSQPGHDLARFEPAAGGPALLIPLDDLVPLDGPGGRVRLAFEEDALYDVEPPRPGRKAKPRRVRTAADAVAARRRVP